MARKAAHKTPSEELQTLVEEAINGNNETEYLVPYIYGTGTIHEVLVNVFPRIGYDRMKRKFYPRNGEGINPS